MENNKLNNNEKTGDFAKLVEYEVFQINADENLVIFISDGKFLTKELSNGEDYANKNVLIKDGKAVLNGQTLKFFEYKGDLYMGSSFEYEGDLYINTSSEISNNFLKNNKIATAETVVAPGKLKVSSKIFEDKKIATAETVVVPGKLKISSKIFEEVEEELER